MCTIPLCIGGPCNAQAEWGLKFHYVEEGSILHRLGRSQFHFVEGAVYYTGWVAFTILLCSGGSILHRLVGYRVQKNALQNILKER